MAWAKDQGIENWEITESDGFVSFVSDPKSDLTSACGMTMTNPGMCGCGLRTAKKFTNFRMSKPATSRTALGRSLRKVQAICLLRREGNCQGGQRL